ncbi:glycoside hydrolase family 32 protein [Fructilactobacillus carniphilus]|uniref:Sucrose-6-phosphate hydrolase n=1 Tax=Fructilactobacillus carniphilus TaxID=2940297 RepID=A0ABY5BV45_9LACO|nr:sucrose-6-phosphate hydrolase [Fructilactobacillus carniphilus]USS90367.1 sucrose-6-phosphate hydrolase [Fructilactobacillus carniphilus]
MKLEQQRMPAVTNDRFRLHYHLMPPQGWMNDPNGFVYFQGYYHLFYQYHPYGVEWGPMHWGHARSQDLLHWETLPPALAPDSEADESGCFSGSAIVKDNRLFLVYTGHHVPDESKPDDFWQTQNVAVSDDGIHFYKLATNPVIETPPADNSQHFRDPKVFERDGQYYLVLGSQLATTQTGRALLYQSTNLVDWEYQGVITAASTASESGFMWECPDFFRLNGQDVLLLSPQGIAATEKENLNLYQTSYLVGQFDFQTLDYQHGNLQELDHGHDFYATQTMLAPDGRRIVVGWMDMWEAEFPEQADGWAGAMTLPRELTWCAGQLCMLPVAEVTQLRTQQVIDEEWHGTERNLAVPDAQHLELHLQTKLASWPVSQLTLQFQAGDQRLQITYHKAQHEVVVTRAGQDAQRFAQVRPQAELDLQIWTDTSSVEIFVNHGAAAFSERFYPLTAPEVTLAADAPVTVQLTGYQLH